MADKSWERLRRPFFIVNPKSYLYGQRLIGLAKVADELARENEVDVIFTGQHSDLRWLAEATSHLLVTAQHVDGHSIGRGMGKVLLESVYQAGARATFLNHAEKPLSLRVLTETMARCHEIGMKTIVCSDSEEETKAIASLGPDMMVCEQRRLIGSGQVAEDAYMRQTTALVKGISPQTQVLQAAGISSPEDVYNAIMNGADGTGGTSGIVCAKDPELMLREMIRALVKAREEIKG